MCTSDPVETSYPNAADCASVLAHHPQEKAYNAAFAATGRISVTALCGITPKGIFIAETIVGSTITLYTDRSFRSGGSPTEKDMLDQFKKKADELRMAASEQNP